MRCGSSPWTTGSGHQPEWVDDARPLSVHLDVPSPCPDDGVMCSDGPDLHGASRGAQGQIRLCHLGHPRALRTLKTRDADDVHALMTNRVQEDLTSSLLPNVPMHCLSGDDDPPPHLW